MQARPGNGYGLTLRIYEGILTVTLVDPKGLLHLNLTDPKLGLYKEIKIIQDRLGDPKLTLNAFVVSWTAFPSLLNTESLTQDDLEACNVLFMREGGQCYLKKMFEKITDALPENGI